MPSSSLYNPQVIVFKAKIKSLEGFLFFFKVEARSLTYREKDKAL
ncbi:hypothetical protein MY3296_009339 [Beauveria thailandica]